MITCETQMTMKVYLILLERSRVIPIHGLGVLECWSGG